MDSHEALSVRPLEITVCPIVQNPSDGGVAISWGVNRLASGWVEYGTSPDKLTQRAISSQQGLVDIDDLFLSVRLRGLKPKQKVYYRVVCATVDYRDAYHIVRGKPVASDVYSFEMPPDGSGSSVRLTCMNDTHDCAATLDALRDLQGEIKPDLEIWNGDVVADVNRPQDITQRLVNVMGERPVQWPVVFVPGNHDYRGAAARQLGKAMKLRTEYGSLGWCYGERVGPVAVVVMDTGEDKADWREEWQGLADFEPYRIAQRGWLEKMLARPEIAQAPYIVVFCHIPLNGLPGQNGGDTGEDYARFSASCRKLWGALLERVRVQLVISGHTHTYRYDVPEEGRSWGQLVGGGCKPQEAALIRVDADERRLCARVIGLDGQTKIERMFMPRSA